MHPRGIFLSFAVILASRNLTVSLVSCQEVWEKITIANKDSSKFASLRLRYQ
jgi:hypothetical protein